MDISDQMSLTQLITLDVDKHADKLKKISAMATAADAAAAAAALKMDVPAQRQQASDLGQELDKLEDQISWLGDHDTSEAQIVCAQITSLRERLESLTGLGCEDTFVKVLLRGLSAKLERLHGVMDDRLLNVSVTTMSGDCAAELRLESGTTINEVKRILSKRVGERAQHLRLVSGGLVLSDLSRLGEVACGNNGVCLSVVTCQ